jgi:hypothetical protein
MFWNGSACVQSTPSNNTTSNCSTGYVWTGLSCQINCSAISGTSGILSLDSCACIQGFTWNGSACVQSTPSNTTNSTTSNCSTGYVWNGFACQINCLAISNSNGQISLNSCACIQGYVWNGSACVQSTPSNTTNSTTSNCSTGYVWTGLSCQINCSAISGTSGILSLDSCACIQGFTWNGSACVQSTPSNTTNSTTSNCSTGYVWNGFACQINCLAISNSNGQISLNSCACIQGYVWNGSACVQSTPSNNTTSNCSTGYVWTGLSCQINCSAISGTSGILSLDSCACIQGFYLERLCLRTKHSKQHYKQHYKQLQHRICLEWFCLSDQLFSHQQQQRTD